MENNFANLSGKIHEILYNRANIVRSVLDRYPKIEASIKANQNKTPQFILKRGKKVVSIEIGNPSWITFKKNKSKSETALFGRKTLNELLEWLNE